MTPEDKEYAIARLDRAEATRTMYRNVYSKDEAVVTIAQMMDDAGYYSLDPAEIKTELIAAVNRLLFNIGAVHPRNTFKFAKAIVSIADDEDLRDQRAAIMAAEKD